MDSIGKDKTSTETDLPCFIKTFIIRLFRQTTNWKTPRSLDTFFSFVDITQYKHDDQSFSYCMHPLVENTMLSPIRKWFLIYESWQDVFWISFFPLIFWNRNTRSENNHCSLWCSSVIYTSNDEMFSSKNLSELCVKAIHSQIIDPFYCKEMFNFNWKQIHANKYALQKKRNDNNSSLIEYEKKRDFTKTTEPRMNKSLNEDEKLCFVIQEHHASILHFDFRLEHNGTLKR